MVDDSASSAPNLWTALEAVVIVRHYAPRDVLFERGQRPEGVYLIQKGKVRVWLPQGGSQPILADLATAGTMLGLSETIAQGAHKLSAAAIAPTTVGFVSGDTLLSFLRERHELCLQVVRMLSEDLHALYHRIHDLKVAPRTRRGPPGRAVS